MLRKSYISFIFSIIFSIIVFIFMSPFIFSDGGYPFLSFIIPVTPLIFSLVGLFFGIKNIIVNKTSGRTIHATIPVFLNIIMLSFFFLYVMYVIETGGMIFG